MKNLKTILILGVIILFTSCKKPLTPETGTCSDGVKGSFSFNVSNGESYDMLINDESTYLINQQTHPTDGTVFDIFAGWRPNETSSFKVLSSFLGGAVLGSTTYTSAEENGGLSLIYVEEVGYTGFSYESTSITLNISEANLCNAFSFCPIVGTFSGSFIKTNVPSETTENVTVTGSFCLYNRL